MSDQQLIGPETVRWLGDEIARYEMDLERDPQDEDAHWALVHLRRLHTRHQVPHTVPSAPREGARLPIPFRPVSATQELAQGHSAIRARIRPTTPSSRQQDLYVMFLKCDRLEGLFDRRDRTFLEYVYGCLTSGRALSEDQQGRLTEMWERTR